MKQPQPRTNNKKHRREFGHAGARNWSTLPVEEMLRIADVYQNGSAAQFLDEAQKLNTTTATLGRQVRGFVMLEGKLRAKYLAESMPASKRPTYDEYIVVDTDNAIVVSDIEIPDHDPRVLQLALLAGMRHGIKTLILAGDVIATDQDALNSWLTTWAEDSAKTFAQCLAELKGMIRSVGLGGYPPSTHCSTSANRPRFLSRWSTEWATNGGVFSAG